MKAGVIVSNSIQLCELYCRHKKLNINDYYLVNNRRRLLGLASTLPVIITHCSSPLEDDVFPTIMRRFKNVYLDDY